MESPAMVRRAVLFVSVTQRGHRPCRRERTAGWLQHSRRSSRFLSSLRVLSSSPSFRACQESWKPSPGPRPGTGWAAVVLWIPAPEGRAPQSRRRCESFSAPQASRRSVVCTCGRGTEDLAAARSCALRRRGGRRSEQRPERHPALQTNVGPWARPQAGGAARRPGPVAPHLPGARCFADIGDPPRDRFRGQRHRTGHTPADRSRRAFPPPPLLGGRPDSR